jgi:hypothetical protein
MNCTFSRSKISGLLAIVPSNERSFVEEIGIFNCPGSFYGNSSGVMIPMLMVHNLSQRLLTGTINACTAAFGVMLTWPSILMRLGPMNFCELIDFQ